MLAMVPARGARLGPSPLFSRLFPWTGRAESAGNRNQSTTATIAAGPFDERGLSALDH